jgi:hypothetical protein
LNLRHFIGPVRLLLSAKHLPDWCVVLLGVWICTPLWVVFRPPIQDFPQHVAAVTVLSNYSNAAFRFFEYFELTLGRTQYLTVYLLAAVIAKALGAVIATKLVLSLSLVATPYGLLRLLRALGLSPWLTLLSLPLVFNVHVAFGFLNFIAAIPILFWGLELAVKELVERNVRRQILLAFVLLLGFLTHIVPFGVLVFGVVLLTRWERGALLRQGLTLLPALSMALLWLVKSPAGRVVTSVGFGGTKEDAIPVYQTFGDALRHVPEWMLDISSGDSDEVRLTIWLIVVLGLLVIATTVPTALRESNEPSQPESLRIERQLWGRVVVGLILPASLVAYVLFPAASGYIWPICQRFPLIAGYFVVPLLGRARPWAVGIAGAIAVWVSVSGILETRILYRETESKAYDGFDEVIGHIPQGSRVATLVFDRNIEGLRLSPLMHAAGWVQAARGGMVMFTFAEFPSSPFTYKETARPPKIPPRWEWVPERVYPDQDLSWYDFVLVHGWKGSLEQSLRFTSVAAQGKWSLWRQVDSSSRKNNPNVKR